MTLIRLMAFGLAASVGSLASGQCGVSTASCLEPHPGVGCVVVECCELVCKANPLCCEIAWDEACATLAQEICDGLVCPSEGSCLEVRNQPGCDDTECCQLVCRVDSFCCFSAWDALCVQAADRLCGVPACSIIVPPNAIDEDEPCYQRLNEGCNRPEDAVLPLVCGEVRTGKWVSGSPRDTDWYEFSLATPTRVTLELVAEFPSQFLLMRGPCEGPFEVLAEANGQPCSSATIDLALEPGVYRCLVAAGIPDRVFRNAFPCDEIDPKNPPDPGLPPPPPPPWNLRYVLTASCAGTLVGDLDGDGIVGPADLAILLGAWGQSGLGDLNGDGVVGSADLAILLGAWTA
jgi:hypothetical protein